MVFTCTKYLWSESHFVYRVVHSTLNIYIRSPRFPTTPECDLSHHHNHNHTPGLKIERMNSPHTIPIPPLSPLPSPPVKPPLSLVARKSRTTWSWMHHIHIPPVWNLQKQVGSPSSTSFQVASRPVTVTPSVHAYIHTFDDERLKRSVRW